MIFLKISQFEWVRLLGTTNGDSLEEAVIFIILLTGGLCASKEHNFRLLILGSHFPQGIYLGKKIGVEFHTWHPLGIL